MGALWAAAGLWSRALGNSTREGWPEPELMVPLGRPTEQTLTLIPSQGGSGGWGSDLETSWAAGWGWGIQSS